MTKTIRTGIAGFGVIGQRRKLFADQNPAYDVVAVCDIKYDTDGELDDGTKQYRQYQQLLDEELDALIVCMPNDMASKVTCAGLERGLHVFCEKPPGRTVEDIHAVREVEARDRGLKLKYGFNHRYHDSVKKALGIVRSFELGRIINMRGVYGKSTFIPWPRPTATGSEKDIMKVWRTSQQIAGGGILIDQGIHMVDLMLMFAGPFTEVKSFVSNGYWQHDVEDNVYALMRSEEGVVAMLHSTATQWRHRFSLEITLEKGGLVLSGILSGTKSYGEEKLTVLYREDEANGLPSELTESYIHDNSWRDELVDFAEAISEDLPISVGTSEDALGVMELVKRIYGSDEAWVRYLQTADPVAGT